MYANAIKQVAAAFDIPVIDAYREWEINPLIDEQRELYFSADAIHPNDNGHKYIAQRFFEYFENFSISLSSLPKDLTTLMPLIISWRIEVAFESTRHCL